jgi:electron transfer flavoprotein alpha subunit
MANFLVFAETRGAELRKVAGEAVSVARRLADATGGGEVHAVVAGPPGVGQKAEMLGRVGADAVLVIESPALTTFAREAIAATIAQRAKTSSYRAIVLGFTAQGRDLGPRLAAKLDAPIVSDVIDIEMAGDLLTVKSRCLSGNASRTSFTLSNIGSPPLQGSYQ